MSRSYLNLYFYSLLKSPFVAKKLPKKNIINRTWMRTLRRYEARLMREIRPQKTYLLNRLGNRTKVWISNTPRYTTHGLSKPHLAITKRPSINTCRTCKKQIPSMPTLKHFYEILPAKLLRWILSFSIHYSWMIDIPRDPMSFELLGERSAAFVYIKRFREKSRQCII